MWVCFCKRGCCYSTTLSTLQRSLSRPQEIRQVLCVADGWQGRFCFCWKTYKPVFSTNPVVPAVPPTHGRPQPQLVQPSLHLLQFLLLQMTCHPCNEETLGGLKEIIHQLLFLLADVWGESCGIPVGFLECSTQHTPYFICYCLDYSILHLV